MSDNRAVLQFLPVFFVLLIQLMSPSSAYAKDGMQQQKLVTVVVKKIRQDQRSIPIDVSGRLHNKTEIKLAFKTGGLVRQVLVDEGQFVEVGQLLAKLDLEEVKAAVAQAKAAYQKAQRDIERIARLNKKNVLSEQKLQNAQTEVILRQADLRVAKFNQKYSEIRASVAGYILHRNIEVNELVQPGQTVFVMGSKNGGWVVRAGLIDRDIVRILLNDRVEVFLDAYPGISLDGRISEISQVVDTGSGTFSVEILLDAAEIKFFSGMVASAIITPKKRQKLFYVPIEAIVDSDINEAQVFLYDRSTGRVERVPIGISFLYQDEVAVSSGLEGHHEVVLSGVKRLESGMTVNAVDQRGFQISATGTSN
ncbi:MAG: efflux RND transporter periplasmic adaptor subunit [Pseudomonadales bacterium]|nr:efflux RND transporter periplasmic adaptor subunit [Pseudomonadales bacterium]